MMSTNTKFTVETKGCHKKYYSDQILNFLAKHKHFWLIKALQNNAKKVYLMLEKNLVKFNTTKV